MNPVRKQRLMIVMIIVVASSSVAALVGYAIGNMGDYFYSVSQVVNGEAPRERSIRAGGCVIPGSILKASDKLETTFRISDGVANMTVTYDGILPDLFGEGEAADELLVGSLVLEDQLLVLAGDVLGQPGDLAVLDQHLLHLLLVDLLDHLDDVVLEAQGGYAGGVAVRAVGLL